MSAIIVPFPARQPTPRPATKANQYAFLRDYSKVWLAIERSKERKVSPADIYAPPEEEMLKLLRRIDRRLAKIASA